MLTSAYTLFLSLSLSFTLTHTPLALVFSSSVKATEKREGGGAHNWGKAEDVDVKYVLVFVVLLFNVVL